METVYKNTGVIVGFLIITFLIEFFGGDKMSYKMLLFILFSMVILNAEKLKNALDTFTSKKEEK